MTPAETERLLLGLKVSEFLVEEAHLLDEWRLEEWLGLFTEDSTYVVPGTDDPAADPKRSLVLIDDDRSRLGWRVGLSRSTPPMLQPWQDSRSAR